MSTTCSGSRLSALAACFSLATLCAATSSAQTIDKRIPHGIGTQIADIFGDGSNVSIATAPSLVVHSDPALVHEHGLDYLEVTGSIQGTGWGGEWEDLGDPSVPPVDAFVHYSYDVPFVLRWAPHWDGTLVYYSHGRAALGLLVIADSALGADNEGRSLEHEGDFVSDLMLTRKRSHAYFSVNLNGLKGDGSFSILGLEPPFLGEPLKATIDVPITRDLVQVAGKLLGKLADKKPERVVGAGHSAGALVMQFLDGALTESPLTGVPTFTGGDYLVPDDPSSPTLFQAFVPFAGSNVHLNPALPMAVPMLMLGGLGEFSAYDSVEYGWRLLDAGLDLNAVFRVYQVRDLPHSWAEIVESTPNLNAFAAQAFGLELHADGDRMQPVAAAALDAAIALLKHGTPPPPSCIDGAGLDTDATPGPDTILFPQASGPGTSLLPSVFDPALDQYVGQQFTLSIAGGFPNGVPRYVAVTDTLVHQPALSLPKLSCRLGGFLISDMFSDSQFLPFPLSMFWSDRGEYLDCVSEAIAALETQGLYATP